MTSSPSGFDDASLPPGEIMRRLREAEAKMYKPSQEEVRVADRIAGELSEEMCREGLWDNYGLRILGEKYEVEEHENEHQDNDVIVGEISRLRYEVEVHVHVRCLGPVGWTPPADTVEPSGERFL